MRSKLRSKFLKITFAFTMFLSFTFIINAKSVKVKESSEDFVGDVYIIGSTKFDNNTVITSGRAAKAGVDAAFIKKLMNENISNMEIPVYYYSELDETWFEIPMEGLKKDETLADYKLSEDEITELEDNLEIFYVNNEVKKLEFNYATDKEVEVITDGVTATKSDEGVVFSIPATTFSFAFKDGEVECDVDTKELNNSDDKLDYGNFEVIKKPEIVIDSADSYALKSLVFNVDIKSNDYTGTNVYEKITITNKDNILKVEEYDDEWVEATIESDVVESDNYILEDSNNNYQITFKDEGIVKLKYEIIDASREEVLATTTKTFDVSIKEVSNLEELKSVIANEFGAFKLTADIDSIDETITIPYTVRIDGNNHKLVFNELERVNGTASGLVLTGNDSNISNLEVSMTKKDGWQGNYAIQVYNATGVLLKDVAANNADAGILVNSSTVTIDGTTTLNGNEFGGIEISKGSAEGLAKGKLIRYKDTTTKQITGLISMDNEATNRPVVWIEPSEGTFTNTTGYVSSKLTNDKGQTYYYSDIKFIKVDVDNETDLLAKLNGRNDINATLIADVTSEKPVKFASPVAPARSLMLNFGDYTFTDTGDFDSSKNIAGLFIYQAKNALLDGNNGGVHATKTLGVDVVLTLKDYTVTIKGGNYIGATTAVQVQKGTLNIEGGFFKAYPTSTVEDDQQRYTINCIDANYKNGTAIVNITGGTFVNFNPADNKAEGEHTNFVAEGYKVVSEEHDDEIWYTVVKDD